MKSPSKRLQSWFGLLAGLLILVFLGAALRRDLLSIRGAGESFPLPGATAVVLSLAAGLAASVLSAWSWARALAVLGVQCSFRDASAIWYNSMVARYIPGTVPGVAYRIYLTTQLGASRAAAAAATALDWVCWLVSAVIAGLIAAPLWLGRGPGFVRSIPAAGQIAVLALALLVGLALLHPRCMNFLLRKAARKVGGEDLPELSYRKTLALLPVYLVKWPFYGFAVAVFLPGFTPAANQGIAVWAAALAMTTAAATAAFAVGWVAGFVSLFSPGGIGVREGVIVGMLFGTASGSVVLEAALLSRLTTTVGEVLCWAWALMGKKVPAPTHLHSAAEPR